MQSAATGSSPDDQDGAAPPETVVLGSAAADNVPFPDHAGLDIDDPWQPLVARRSAGWQQRGLRQLSELLEVVALAILMFMAVHAMGQNFIVDGSSMVPTFQNSELLIVNRVAYLDVDLSWLPTVDEEHWRPFGEPEQGDVVVFAAPPDETRDFIKRVVAVGGQTIEAHDGIVVVDGIVLSEPYLDELEDWDGSIPAQTVAEGYLFVMGDNRKHSSDSRSWGVLDERLLVGRADLRYWPFDRIGLVDHHQQDSAVTGEPSAAR